ncbi:MAG: zf-TFIIB domain-containing protein [Planctomycetes bacterium]|nr:zf-TFIIB domain-containing protein [Planctomycetota bacterium]
MRCPGCELANMGKARIGEERLEVTMCPNCHATWFDTDELGAFLGDAAKGLRVPKQARHSEMKCPYCKEQMYSFQFPYTQLEVDMCKKCKGLWVDGKNTKKVLRAMSEVKKRGWPDKKWGRKKGILGRIKSIFSK